MWLDSGIYQVLVQHGAEKTAKVFNYSGGTGVITPPPPPPVPEPVVVVESAVSTTTIQNSQGSSTPGCEPDCFIPRVASVERNALITFENNDLAAHTSTAGTPADGPSGIWDSSLIMNGQNYSIRLSNDGIYPYFCMVHPWMEGTIVVGDGNVIEEPVAIIEPEPLLTSPALPFTLTTSSSDYRLLVDDTIVISGNVGNVIINEIEPYVTLQAFYENNEYFSRFVEVLPNGDFEEIEDIDFGGYGSIGTWTLKATYGDKTAETSFTISPQHGFISPTIYYEIVGSEFVMVLEKPVNYDQDYHTIRDFNEAANFSLLESFVTTEVNPIGALENIITSLHPYGDEAYDNLDSVQSVNRWNSDGTETNEYIEAWMTAVAISDLDNLSYHLIQLTNAGMSIEVAFDNQRPYYQNNQGGDMIGELNPSTPNNTILPLTFLVPLTPSSIPSSPPPVPEPSSSSNPMNATVENAQGSSTPGCEPDCFIPSTVTIAPGGMVTFSNTDNAAHTSTSGTPGGDNMGAAWDSSLVMMNSSYTTPALAAGEYPYFCMVHPWMNGWVIVADEPASINVGTESTSYSAGDLVNITGDSTQTSTTITLTIANSSGTVETLNITSKSDGEFLTIWMIPSDIASGTYTMTASDGILTNSTSFTVTVQESSITSPALSTSECQALAEQRGHDDDDHLVCQFPFDITVYVGERVAWMETKTWAGTYYHTITSVDGFFDMTDMGSTSFLPSAWNGTGVYNYYDKLNPSLTGTITVIEESLNPMSVTVENAAGSSTPGCEPDCFIPSTVTIAPGGMVTFSNTDNAAHTSTSGTPGGDNMGAAWDSSLVMMNSSYTTPALAAGEYPYFCMVHPWMEGLVIVD